ncbi:MAG: DUF4336 domain-containing protein [Myxococcota bacterium]|nr:DUF4336 domain-containing protein [Myxococcota bacterium]
MVAGTHSHRAERRVWNQSEELAEGADFERAAEMLKRLDSNLFVADHDFSLLGANIGTRTSVIQLSEGGLWIHSPGPMEAELADEIDALGEVRYLVAPNDFHHLYIGDYVQRWPSARCYAAPGLSLKRKDLAFHAELSDEPDPGWAADLDQVWIGGAPKVNEVVFLHKSSRTLLLVDLVFNMRSKNLLESLFLRINGSVGLGTSRLMRFMLKDLEATRASVQRIMEWDFDRVIMAHGEILEQDAKSSLRASFDWLLGS